MSMVTTVIVILGDDPDGTTLTAISAFTGNSQGIPLKFGTRIEHCGEQVGGYKCAECDIYIAAFNHFDWQGFFLHLDTITWESPDDSAVILQSSDYCSIAMYSPIPRDG